MLHMCYCHYVAVSLERSQAHHCHSLFKVGLDMYPSMISSKSSGILLRLMNTDSERPGHRRQHASPASRT